MAHQTEKKIIENPWTGYGGKIIFYFIRSYLLFSTSVQALSFEACECDSTPSHTKNGVEVCDFQHS